MTRITFMKGLLLNLEGKIGTESRAFLTRDAALSRLKQATGQDFGYDAERWRAWLKSQNKSTKAAAVPAE